MTILTILVLMFALLGIVRDRSLRYPRLENEHRLIFLFQLLLLQHPTHLLECVASVEKTSDMLVGARSTIQEMHAVDRLPSFQPFCSSFISLVRLRPLHLHPLLAPWEMQYRHNEEAVARVRNASQRIIPSRKCRKDTKSTTRTQAANLRSLRGVLKVGNAQHKESHIEGEEQEEEGDGRFQGAEEQDESEDEPTLEKSYVRVGVPNWSAVKEVSPSRKIQQRFQNRSRFLLR